MILGSHLRTSGAFPNAGTTRLRVTKTLLVMSEESASLVVTNMTRPMSAKSSRERRMSYLRHLLNRLVWSLAATLIGWVSCTLPMDKPSAVLAMACRVFSWPTRFVLSVLSAVGIQSDPLSVGWCDFCSSEQRLWRALLTGISIYLVLLYVPTIMLWIVRRFRTEDGRTRR